MIRKHLRLDIVDPEFSRDRARRGPIVAGQHDDLDAFRCQCFEGVRRRLLDWIGDREQSRELSVDCDVDDGGAVSAQTLAICVE